VVFHDWVDRAMSRQAMHDADMLLLLAQRQPEQIPQKLYEYLGARKPILAFIDQGGDCWKLLQDVAGHFLVADPDSPTGQREIKEALIGARTNRIQNEDILTAMTTEAQMQKLTALVDRVVAKPRH
jgi:hypothetical protein